jgi:hypothetical protein
MSIIEADIDFIREYLAVSGYFVLRDIAAFQEMVR